MQPLGEWCKDGGFILQWNLYLYQWLNDLNDENDEKQNVIGIVSQVVIN